MKRSKCTAKYRKVPKRTIKQAWRKALKIVGPKAITFKNFKSELYKNFMAHCKIA